MNKITINILEDKIYISSYDKDIPENNYSGTTTRKDLLDLLCSPKIIFKSYKKSKSDDGKIVEIINTPEAVLRISGLDKLKNTPEFVMVKKKIAEAIAISEYKNQAPKNKSKANRKKSMSGKIQKVSAIILLYVTLQSLLIGVTIKNNDVTLTDKPSIKYEELVEKIPSFENTENYNIPTDEIYENMGLKENKYENIGEEMVSKKTIYNYIVTMDYENQYLSEKVNDCRRDYLEVLSKYSKMYGVDGNFFLAQACQEKGFHSSIPEPDGGLGILQLQYEVWENSDFEAYNFETNTYDKVHILYLGENKTGRTDVIEIDLRELEDQVRFAAMIDAKYLKDYNGNYELTAYAYNWGQTASSRHIQKYCEDYGLNYNDAINGKYDNNIRDYYLNEYGDNYFLKVSQFLPNAEIQLTSKIHYDDGTIAESRTIVQNSRVMNQKINSV